MRICVYACMRVCVYASMSVCVYVCMRAPTQATDSYDTAHYHYRLHKLLKPGFRPPILQIV